MPIDRDLLDFIREHVRSVWLLEQILLMRRTAGRSWNAKDLARELRSSESLVIANFEALERIGVVARDANSEARFSPVSPVLAKICDDLEIAYRDRPVTIINAIARPADRIQGLADAFKLRGSEE